MINGCADRGKGENNDKAAGCSGEGAQYVNKSSSPVLGVDGGIEQADDSVRGMRTLHLRPVDIGRVHHSLTLPYDVQWQKLRRSSAVIAPGMHVKRAGGGNRPGATKMV